MRFLSGIVFLFCCAPLRGAELPGPPRDPILRIETGSHTAPIRHIALDETQHVLATVSNDKTLRVWDFPSGRLLQAIRVPIGADEEGNLSALALSPDGKTIAVGGATGFSWGSGCVYLFDRASGRLSRRLCDFPNWVNSLAYSPDGRLLAVGLYRENGLRIFTTPSYTPAGSDTDYGFDIYSMDFHGPGRLVTGAFDGLVRIYSVSRDGSIRLLAKRGVPGGKEIFSVKFSPDGSKIAVTTNDAKYVAVLRSSDLQVLQTPDVSAIDGLFLGATWSQDGSTLYGAGSTDFPGNSWDLRKVVRKWSGSELREHTDLQVDTHQTMLDILSLRQGGILYGSGDGSFGAIDAAGRRLLFSPPAIADLRDNEQGFAIARDGGGIAFSYLWAGQAPARFSVRDRSLQLGMAAEAGWKAPETDDASLRVEGWRHQENPTVNGIALTLASGERAHSLALAPDRSSFLLGTEFDVRLFNRDGSQRWQADGARLAWAVNVSRDGKIAAAALGDGTIRWYRMQDGKLLLTLFPHPDRKRWVIWSPSGYYDASPGAEDLIGWHVNNGADAAADFFPVAQFRDSYYRPDVVAKILELGDERVAVQAANEQSGRRSQVSVAEQLPPVVEIISPAEGATVTSTNLTARYRVRTPSGEAVTAIKVLVNGRPLGDRAIGVKPVVGSEQTSEIAITIPQRDSEVAIIAENRYTASVPASVHIKWAAPTGGNTAADLLKPKLYVLAVGVSQYANQKFDLRLADKDARDFTNSMTGQQGLLYREVVTKTLINAEATREAILDGLDWILKETTSNDLAMVFLAGHGVNDQNSNYYFLPHSIDPDRLRSTGIPFSDIRNAVSAIAGKALFFVDTCHSGNVIGLATRRGAQDINAVINELASAENGVVVFSASTGSESSLEHEEWNNGAFTKALVEGLDGAASTGASGRITYNMLNLYVSERVKELTSGQQHPTVVSPHTVPDFPIAMKR